MLFKRLMGVWLVTAIGGVYAGDNPSPSDLPLQGDIPLRFTVEEVTWLSIDTAPDGSQLAMEVLGDLYLLPIEGGTAQPLSVGMAFDAQPRFSPNGENIAFISDRDGTQQVWVMDMATRDLRKLSSTSDRMLMASPYWSPDGNHVVVSQGTPELGVYELWAYALAGGEGVRLTRARKEPDTPLEKRHNALGAVYGPAGRYLYYARKTGGFGYNLRFPLWQIARRDLQTGREDILTAAPGSAVRPLLSPNGRYLVYGTRYEQQTGLRIRDLTTGADEWLAYPIQRDEQESRYTRDLLPGYAFTADGASVIASRNGGLIRIHLSDKRIEPVPFSVEVDKHAVERLNFPYRVGLGPVKARVLRDAKLSPDGNKLAFSAFSRVYVHDLVKSQSVPVSPAGTIAAFPDWSPKGHELVYVSWDVGGGHIYRSKARPGARPTRLTEAPGYYLSPVWSPDGKRIVAMRGPAHERLGSQGRVGPTTGSEVIWLRANGGAVRIVAPSRGFGRPHFGPESDRIYLHTIAAVSPGESKAGLVSMRYDGTDIREVLGVSGPGIYNQGEDIGARTLQISPDGRHVLFNHADQLYVTALIPHLPNQNIKLAKPQLPTVKLTDVGADFSGWSARGDLLTWSVGNRLYRRPLDSVDFFDSHKKAGEDDQSEEENHDERLREEHAAVSFDDVNLYLPRHKPEGVIAFVNCTVISMSGSGIIRNGVVVVEDDRITAVGQAANVEIPGRARAIDLQGEYVLPGFVDTHAHYRAARDVPGTVNASFLANLAYGVTTGMDVQPSTLDILSAQELVDAGLMPGPRAFSTGPGVFNNNSFESKAHALAVLRRYRDFYQVRNIKAYMSGSRKQRQWLIQAARELRLMPTTEGGLDMKMDLTHALDGFSGLEHNYPLPLLYDDVVQLTARTGMAYTPTLLVTYGGPWAENYYYTRESPHDDPKLRRFTPYADLAKRTLRRPWFHEREYTFRDVAASSLKIVEAGGQVGIGAHGQLQGLGYHWELWSVASGGYQPLQVLQLATIGGARMLGIGQDLGSIEPGKLADLLVLKRNPLEDIRNTLALRYVMKGGDLYEADTLNQVWPTAKPLPAPWWLSSNPAQ